jgi:hypothetical protein
MSSKYLKGKELEWLLRRASCDWRELDVNLQSIHATSWLAVQLWIINGHENVLSWYLAVHLRVCIHCSLFLIQLRGKNENLDVSIFQSLIH